MSDARQALDEARELDAGSSQLQELEERFASLQRPVEAAADSAAAPDVTLRTADVTLPADVTIEPRFVPVMPMRRTRWLMPVAAGALVLAAGAAALGSRYYWQQAPPTTESAVPPPPAPQVAQARIDLPVPPVLRILRETIRAAVQQPELVSDPMRLPGFPGPPIAAPETEATPADQPVMAVNRADTAPTPLPVTPRSELTFDALATAPPPEPLVQPAASAAVPSSPEPAALAPRAEPEPVDESSMVRSVLARYERAYNTLDADAASEVWPRVDRPALARAFEGLTSQRVSLQACNVTVNGAAAHASCSGTAMWVPKVGGGARTAPRRWDFDLRKAGDDWRIERAVTR